MLGRAPKRQAVQVDQDVDLVGADGTGGLLVGLGVDADVVVHRLDHAGADRRAVLAAPAEGVHLELAAVVQLVQLGGQDGYRVRAEVRRQVADAQAAVAVAVLAGQRRDGGVDLFVDEAARGGQLLGRVGRGAEHGQRRGAVHHGGDRDVFEAAVHRPLALLLAQVDPVGHDVGLLRIDAQAQRQHGLGLGIALADFQQAAEVVQGLHVQRRIGLDVRLHLVGEDGLPHRQRVVGAAGAFQQGAEVEAGFDEAGVLADGLAQHRLGAGVVAGIGQHHGQVEAGGVDQRRRRVVDPGTVQADGGGQLSAFLQHGGGAEQVADRQHPPDGQRHDGAQRAGIGGSGGGGYLSGHSRRRMG